MIMIMIIMMMVMMHRGIVQPVGMEKWLVHGSMEERDRKNLGRIRTCLTG